MKDARGEEEAKPGRLLFASARMRAVCRIEPGERSYDPGPTDLSVREAIWSASGVRLLGLLPANIEEPSREKQWRERCRHLACTWSGLPWTS